MSAPCAYELPTGGRCQAKKAAPVHSKHHPSFHEYQDASRGGLKPVSDGRAAYQASSEHKDAYAAGSGAVCLAGVAGAPGECFGPLSPHHIFSRAQAGGLEAAERYPVVSLCESHNGAVQADPRMRRWSMTHFFERDGKEWPFLLSVRAEREYRERTENPVRI